MDKRLISQLGEALGGWMRAETELEKTADAVATRIGPDTERGKRLLDAAHEQYDKATEELFYAIRAVAA